MSIPGFRRSSARRISLLRFSSASQDNTTRAAGRSGEHGCPPAAIGTRSIFWSVRSPDAAAPDNPATQTDAADNIQSLDRRRPMKWRDIAGESPRRWRHLQKPTILSPEAPACLEREARLRYRPREARDRPRELPAYVQA